MTWYNGLTDEQKEAAKFYGMHARLLAGPGTGKTRSLTRHVLFLINEKNIEPSKIITVILPGPFPVEACHTRRRALRPVVRQERLPPGRSQ